MAKKLTDAQKKQIALRGQEKLIADFNKIENNIKNGMKKVESDTLFDKAKALVYGDRNIEYGDFKAGYSQALELYRAWNFGKIEIRSVSDLMILMVFIKLARNRNATKEDNILDAIGYLEMHWRSLPSNLGQ